MKTVTEKIWDILDNSPSIMRDMNRGIINKRALAKYLKSQYKMETSIDSIISAIRRYEPKESAEILKIALPILNESTISTKSKLANIALIKGSEIQNRLPKLFSLIQFNRGDVLRIIQADESFKILIDEKNLDKVKKLFPTTEIIKIDTNLAEINVHIPERAIDTPGVIGFISNELAINGISIKELISCVPELLLFVDEKDILKSHQVLYNLCTKRSL